MYLSKWDEEAKELVLKSFGYYSSNNDKELSNI